MFLPCGANATSLLLIMALSVCTRMPLDAPESVTLFECMGHHGHPTSRNRQGSWAPVRRPANPFHRARSPTLLLSGESGQHSGCGWDGDMNRWYAAKHGTSQSESAWDFILDLCAKRPTW